MNNNYASIVETITPEVASAYLRHNKDNRPVNQARVEFYAKQILAGQWKVNGESIAFDVEGTLVNGQHRLLAIKKAGKPVNMLVFRGADKGSFATYDSGYNRSAKDAFAICDILNYSGISATVKKFYIFQKGQNAIANANKNRSNTDLKLSNLDLLNIYNRYPEIFQEFFNYAGCLTNRNKLFGASEVAGLMCFLHITKGHDKLYIFRFFDLLFGYRQHEGYKEMEASRKLRERIIKNALESKAMKLSNAYKGQLLAKAWNCYVTGKDTKVLKYVENETINYL